MTPKMIDMGIKRKDMMPGELATKSEKEYDNETTYPELNLSGPQAELMGAEEMKEGDVVKQMVQWRVKRHSKTEEGGKTDYSMTLCLEKASDCVECDAADGKKGKGDEADDDGDSPAMSYIQGQAKSAE